MPGTWLEETTHDGHWSFGCSVCKEGCFGRGEASSVRFSVLSKHHKSAAHQESVARLLGRSVPLAFNRVPSRISFEKALDCKLQGAPLRTGTSDEAQVIKGKRLQKFLFCMKEAQRQIERKFMRTCKSISLHQDVAGKRLLVKYVASNDKLESRSGFLGSCNVLSDGNGGASSVAKATKVIVQNFATPFHGCPKTGAGKEKRVAKLQLLDVVLEEWGRLKHGHRSV
jgi:hypothetical protein